MQTTRSTPSSKQIDTALLVLRLALGAIFIAHGAQKLFVFGFAGVTGAFTHMGVPMAAVVAPLVAIVELAAGLAVLVGFLTRLAALGLAIDMLGAIALVHAKNGFFLPAGAEFAIALFASSTALVIAGAGAWSLDAVLGTARSVDDARGAGVRRAAA